MLENDGCLFSGPSGSWEGGGHGFVSRYGRAYLALKRELPSGHIGKGACHRDHEVLHLSLSCCSVFQEHTMFPPQRQAAHPWKTHPVLTPCSTKNRKIDPCVTSLKDSGYAQEKKKKKIFSKPWVKCFLPRLSGADAEETLSLGKRSFLS